MPLNLSSQNQSYAWNVPLLTEELIPAEALPAVEQLFSHPEDVALVVYRVDYEGIGFYHNPDQLMPLASASKLIQLAAYAEAVALGEIDPTEKVPIDELERYYLPRSDLGAHNEALDALDRDALTLDDLAWMMIRHSANSAADYLHNRLGQARIEQVAQEIGLSSHTAPCTYLGRFLLMNQLNSSTIERFTTNPTTYGEAVTLLSDQYLNDDRFYTEAATSWQRGQQPPLSIQRRFVAELETQGTANQYALLLAQLVTDRLGKPGTEAEALMRKHLEWPHAEFEINQIRYATVGYKNGTMPGALTTTYYAWPYWSDRPIVLALFYKDLPNETYRRWRRTFPHDELAHWLMSDPEAIHILHLLRDQAEN